MIKARIDLGERCASHVDMESEQAAKWFEPSLHLESLFRDPYFLMQRSSLQFMQLYFFGEERPMILRRVDIDASLYLRVGPDIKGSRAMTNPFEEEKTDYYALTNDEGQFSLWPASIEVPNGWTIVAGPSNRNDCVSYVEMHWSDMRPRSLIESQRPR